MNIQEYMKLPYNVVIKQISDESGTYFHATVLELNGCQSTGETFQEAYEGIQEAMEGWIETKLNNGFTVPAPIDTESYSRGKGGITMSEREQAKQIIDQLPEYKIRDILIFLRGMAFDDEIEDDLYCERLVENYINDPDPSKHETITLEELAKRNGITLKDQCR